MQDYAQAYSFIAALTGDPENAVIDFRAINDRRQDVPAMPRRGTLAQCWQELCAWNNQNYGIFCTIAAMDGAGRELANVQYLRANYVDLDNLSAEQNLQRAASFVPAPSFAVETSPGKYHIYWPVQPYAGNDRFTVVQRKLRQMFDGDKAVIDAARVMRLPGTLHTKYDPHMVRCFALGGYGVPITVEHLEYTLQSVNVVDGGGGRHDLGEPTLAAPSMEWLKYGLDCCDPNELDRADWIAITAAFKQAAWSLADPDTVFQMWSDWCARYASNDVAENDKHWKSIRNSEVGWKYLTNKIPSLKARFHLGAPTQQQVVTPAPVTPGAPLQVTVSVGAVPPMPEPPALDCSGEILTEIEQKTWFKDVTYVVNLGEMLTKGNRFLNTGQFNVEYGGKKFIIDSTGKLVTEAWQAATRSTLWQVPKVDHIRFIPSKPYGEIIVDDLGRKGINTYLQPNIRRLQGDVSPFLRHMEMMLPVDTDRKILMDYLAHNIKYPGYKIPWAFLIQSMEGVGKGVLKNVISHAIGRPYVYFPNAKDLSDSGSKFNAWMRNKLFILADEIKVDDRRDMIEVLKPMISEETIEIQSKGHDQDIEDNFSNWGFFSNYKDAIPINKNARRFAVFFSAIQSIEDLRARGMSDDYFAWLYAWLKGENGHPHGAAIVADYFMNYEIERGAIPMRAPMTSSTAEAHKLSRGPIERMIDEAIEDGLPGFRGGWISTISVVNRMKVKGLRSVSEGVLESIIGGMGYVSRGRALRPYFQEDQASKSHLFALDANAPVEWFAQWQGWE